LAPPRVDVTPRVIGITGHQEIPTEIREYVRKALAAACAAAAPRLTGVTCLAAGADQLFASVVLELGGALHVIVPSREYETSFTAAADLACFRDLLARAESVEELDYPRPSEDAYAEAGHHVVDRADVVLAVWDGTPAKGKGGTGDIVEYAHRQQVPVTVVWPQGVSRES
jgi:hypothetical protein